LTQKKKDVNLSFVIFRFWLSCLGLLVYLPYIRYLGFYYYHWVDTSAGRLFAPEGIIRPVVSASTLTWYIRYIYYLNILFLNNAIINKNRIHPLGIGDLSRFSPPSGIGDRSLFWLSCLGPLGYLLPKTFTLFGFPMFW